MVSGTALALGGGASLLIGTATPLPAVLAVFLLFGVFLGAVNPPITNTAVSGMPRSMAGLGAGILILGVFSTGPRARQTAVRAAELFEGVETGPKSR